MGAGADPLAMASPTSQIDTGSSPTFELFGTVRPHIHWLIRAAFAAVFIYHGITKFPTAAGLTEMMGMPVAMIYLLGTVELIAGVLVLAGGIGPGWKSRLSGLLVIPVMLGAIAMVHWPRWSFVPAEGFPMGGTEFQALLATVAAYLLVRGNDI